MFEEIIISVVVGWSLGTTSTWLILAKPWLDRRLLPSRRTIVTQQLPVAPAPAKVV
jgi:hypothetical protein